MMSTAVIIIVAVIDDDGIKMLSMAGEKWQESVECREKKD